MTRFKRVYWFWFAVLMAFFVVANTIWSTPGKIQRLGFPLSYAERFFEGETRWFNPLGLAVNAVAAIALSTCIARALARHRCGPESAVGREASPTAQQGKAE